MKFLWTTILAKDMEETLKFYQEIVGLKIDKRFSGGPGTEICFMGEDDTKLEIIHNEKVQDIDAGNAVTLGFRVDSLDEMLKFVTEKGIQIKTGPVQPNPEIKFFIIQDPNGIKVQFAQQMNQ